MSRYINQDKVIDAVLNLDTTHRVSWRDAVIDMIDCMSPEDVQPVRWIPCSERLPEALQEVLVTSTHGYVYTSRIVHGDFEYGGNVIAWMPLPEPYQEGADK